MKRCLASGLKCPIVLLANMGISCIPKILIQSVNGIAFARMMTLQRWTEVHPVKIKVEHNEARA